jgi:hypothetical protein
MNLMIPNIEKKMELSNAKLLKLSPQVFIYQWSQKNLDKE